MDTHELAWAAGFFDGEGCITTSRGLPVISITQVDREVLDRFREAVGTGSVNGPYSISIDRPGFANAKPQYKYQLSRLDDVRDAVAKLAPYLSSVKLNKALVLLDRVADRQGRARDFRLTPIDVRNISRRTLHG